VRPDRAHETQVRAYAATSPQLSTRREPLVERSANGTSQSQSPRIEGTVAAGFEPVREAFALNFAEGLEAGASVAVTLAGETVVDLWGGSTGSPNRVDWVSDTLANTFSTTKTIAALSALVLIGRGEVRLDQPVSDLWPEFAANGKADITIAQVLNHTSGLPGWDIQVTLPDLADTAKLTDALARQRPWWEPGTRAGYHAITSGFLIGEIVRRVTGQSIGSFIRDHLAGPRDADYYLGLDPAVEARVAPIIPAKPRAAPGGEVPWRPDSIIARVLANPSLDAEWANTEVWRRSQIASINGHGNARSVACLQQILLDEASEGGLGSALVGRMLAEARVWKDTVMLAPIGWSYGYATTAPGVPRIRDSRVLFWGGWGGSFTLVDLDRSMVFAYVMNQMSGGTLGDRRSQRLLRRVYECLNVPETAVVTEVDSDES
jgi:CubicO group peptidase (beta-lactamase class C family)